MTNDIFCVGLTRTELQTLGVLLPITFRIIPVSSEALDHAAVVRVIDQARCIILNPKQLSVDLLDDFLRGQDYQRWNNAPVPIILFSDTMTREQRHEVFMPEYPILSVDLHERFDRNRNLAVKLLRESALPCWQNRKVMRLTMRGICSTLKRPDWTDGKTVSLPSALPAWQIMKSTGSDRRFIFVKINCCQHKFLKLPVSQTICWRAAFRWKKHWKNWTVFLARIRRSCLPTRILQLAF